MDGHVANIDFRFAAAARTRATYRAFFHIAIFALSFVMRAAPSAGLCWFFASFDTAHSLAGAFHKSPLFHNWKGQVSPLPAHAGAFVLRDALLKLGGTSFQNQTWKVVLTPDTPVQQQRTLVPDGTISDVDSATWVMEIEGLQDWENGGLAAYLQSVAGTQISFEVAPRNTAGKKKATGTVVAVSPPFGGEQGEFAQMEMELPILGQPVFTTV